jgi:hypothetical protein
VKRAEKEFEEMETRRGEIEKAMLFQLKAEAVIYSSLHSS